MCIKVEIPLTGTPTEPKGEGLGFDANDGYCTTSEYAAGLSGPISWGQKTETNDKIIGNLALREASGGNLGRRGPTIVESSAWQDANRSTSAYRDHG